MVVRNIIHIDEELCNGCGDCITSCAEGALQIVNGKAKLVKDIYCDGLGACIGECPTGALRIEQRESDDFDEEAVQQRVASMQNKKPISSSSLPVVNAPATGSGCPGTMLRQFQNPNRPTVPVADGETPSELTQWPIQLNLVPVNAPFYQGARLSIAADCVPFAYPDFHQRLLADRKLLIGCPKLDDNEFYLEKLTQIFQQNEIQSIEVAYMEVPCCFGLVHSVKTALERSGKSIPLELIKISIQGSICEIESVNG
jgi:ferredoxin